MPCARNALSSSCMRPILHKPRTITRFLNLCDDCRNLSSLHSTIVSSHNVLSQQNPHSNKDWRCAGLFARANSVNNNMRLYPKKILAREVRKYVRDQVQAKCALGELDHPSYCAPTFKHLNLVNISHQVRRYPCLYYWVGLQHLLSKCDTQYSTARRS
jgi:Prohead core protein serine protease